MSRSANLYRPVCGAPHNRHGLRSAPRTGSSLIEALAVVSLIAVVLSTSSLIFHQALDAHRSSLVAFRELEQLNVWYDRFRSDSQQSLVAELETTVAEAGEGDIAAAAQAGAGNSLLLQRADGTSVRYRLREQRLTRQVERDGRVTSQEAWQTWLLEDVQWNIEPSGQLELISCLLHFPAGTTTKAPIEWLARGPVVTAQATQQTTSDAGASNVQ